MSQSWDNVANMQSYWQHAQYNRDCQLVQCACADTQTLNLCYYGIDHTPLTAGQEQLLELTM